MKISNYKTFSIFLLLTLVTVSLNSHAFGWSWRDLRVGVTTEEEVLNHGGWPEEVILFPEFYFELKRGKPPGMVRFKYEDSEVSRGLLKAYRLIPNLVPKLPYNPLKTPIITEAPLRLSEEMKEIEAWVHLSSGKLSGFRYFFRFWSKFDRKKYIDIFNAILGKPIQIKETKDYILIKYDDDYELYIEDLEIRLSKAK